MHRLTDYLTPYQPQDEFFAPIYDAAKQGGEQKQGPKLADAVAAYMAAKAGVHWTSRTELEQRRVLRWVEEYFGADTRIGDITKDQVREFRNALVKLQFKGPAHAPITSLVGTSEQGAISRKTAQKYFSYLTAACNWWVGEGLMPTSPVGNINVAVPRGRKSGEREAFTQGDLQILFSSPMFTGCQGATRRMEPGPHLITDDYYWVPLIAACSGMRLGEIVQLGLFDSLLDGPIPHMRVRADPQTGGTVKSDAGWRDVPIHRRLVQLGFTKFVAARQSKHEHARLLHNIPYGSDGSASGEYSRWFGRRMTAIRLKRPGLVFHSFRGTFIGALINAEAPLTVVKAIVGHELNDDITVGYSGHEGVSLKQKQKWVDRFDLLNQLPKKLCKA